jgi:quinol monooxygenase YgiN
MSTNQKVFLHVVIHIKPGKMDGFLKRIKSHMELMRAEDGCEMLTLLEDKQHENTICVWEVWRDRPAWDAHMVIEHSKIWQKDAPEFVASEAITILSAI